MLGLGGKESLDKIIEKNRGRLTFRLEEGGAKEVLNQFLKEKPAVQEKLTRESDVLREQEPKVRDILKKFAGGRDKEKIHAALQALSLIAHPDDASFFAGILDKGDTYSRDYSADGLGRMGLSARSWLVKLLKAENPRTRQMAVIAATKTTHPAVLKILDLALESGKEAALLAMAVPTMHWERRGPILDDHLPGFIAKAIERFGDEEDDKTIKAAVDHLRYNRKFLNRFKPSSNAPGYYIALLMGARHRTAVIFGWISMAVEVVFLLGFPLVLIFIPELSGIPVNFLKVLVPFLSVISVIALADFHVKLRLELGDHHSRGQPKSQFEKEAFLRHALVFLPYILFSLSLSLATVVPTLGFPLALFFGISSPLIQTIYDIFQMHIYPNRLNSLKENQEEKTASWLAEIVVSANRRDLGSLIPLRTNGVGLIDGPIFDDEAALIENLSFWFEDDSFVSLLMTNVQEGSGDTDLSDREVEVLVALIYSQVTKKGTIQKIQATSKVGENRLLIYKNTQSDPSVDRIRLITGILNVNINNPITLLIEPGSENRAWEALQSLKDFNLPTGKITPLVDGREGRRPFLNQRLLDLEGLRAEYQPSLIVAPASMLPARTPPDVIRWNELVPLTSLGLSRLFRLVRRVLQNA